MRERFYFAYGSNMDPRRMRDRCRRAECLGRATLRGYRFLINERGVATIELQGNAKVMGALWKITSRCEAALDQFEGVHRGTYFKKDVEVVLDETGQTLDALVYIDPICERGFPRAGYWQRIAFGAKSVGIPHENFASYLRWARCYAA